MRLLERDPALESLLGHAGEAGVGKTSLVEHLAEQLPDARWLWGRCDGAFTPEPLAALADIVGDVGGDMLRTWRDGAGQQQLFRALLDDLTGGARLTVVVIEDVHWADEATLDLLRFLGARLRQANVLVVATYRDDGLAPHDPLRVTLGELSSQRATRRIGLAPLSAHAVAVLAEGTAIATGDLFTLTGGNPFLVSEVLDAGPADL